MATPGCVSEITEMECGRSEIDELIKEVSGQPRQRSGPRPGSRVAPALPRRPEPWAVSGGGTSSPDLCHLASPFPPVPSFIPGAGAELPALCQ